MVFNRKRKSMTPHPNFRAKFSRSGRGPRSLSYSNKYYARKAYGGFKKYGGPIVSSMRLARKMYKGKKTGRTRYQMGNDIEKSFTKTVYKKTKLSQTMSEIGNICTIKNVAPFPTLVAASQVQAVSIGNAVYQGVGGTANYTIRSIFDECATAFNTTAAALITQDPTTAHYKSAKLLLQNCDLKYRIMNQNPAVVELDIYNLVSNLTQPTILSPIAAWDNGLNDIYANNTAITSASIDTRPNSSRQFTQTWKIVKKTTVSLQPGKQHNHFWAFQPNRVVDTDYFAQYAQVKGLTAVCMFVARGGIADSATTAAVGTIAFTPIKIVFVEEITFGSKLVNFWPRSYQFNSTLAAAPSHLYVQDEESGLVDDLITGLGIAATVAAIA